jgi:hypothetical protein
MPGRGPQTFKKRQKEQQRKERREEKMAKRLNRKAEGSQGDTPDQEPGLDLGEPSQDALPVASDPNRTS